MKKAIVLVSLSLLVGSAYANTLKVDTKSASVEWKAEKNVGGGHNGTVALKSGNLESDGKAITGGEFVIDMKSMKDLDITDKADNAKLIKHLSSDDFFSIEKNPEAKFVAKKISHLEGDKYNVDGELTVKGITNGLSFPATITNEGKTYKMAADIVVDRTKWDVRYGSKNFFPDLVANKVIKNEFNVKVAMTTEEAGVAAKPAKKKK